MKKEITEYYCDVCGKKVDRSNDLELIKIPIRQIKYSFSSSSNSKILHSFEICPECMNALYEVIQEHFADIRREEYPDGSYKIGTHSIKYKENKDE